MDPDVIQKLVDQLGFSVERIANAIADQDASPGNDEAGGVVSCLTGSVMGVTAGLFKIAESIDNLADAVRDRWLDP